MVSVGANRNKKAYGIKHYNLDTEDDLQKINVNREVMGTTAFVIDTSTRYMLNGSKEWKKISAAFNGGGSGSNDEIYDGGGVEGDDNIYDGGGVEGDSGSSGGNSGSGDSGYDGGGI
jgi:hypothetical protein